MGEENIFETFGAVVGLSIVIIVCVMSYLCKKQKRRAKVQLFDSTSYKHVSRTFRLRYRDVTFDIKYSKEEIVSDIPLVVLCISTSRVEDECRSALEGISYTPSTTLLAVFHRLKGSDISDVISFFKCISVAETVHLGFTEKRTKFPKATDKQIKDFLKKLTH